MDSSIRLEGIIEKSLALLNRCKCAQCQTEMKIIKKAEEIRLEEIRNGEKEREVRKMRPSS